jgi:hypothetical protein
MYEWTLPPREFADRYRDDLVGEAEAHLALGNHDRDAKTDWRREIRFLTTCSAVALRVYCGLDDLDALRLSSQDLRAAALEMEKAKLDALAELVRDQLKIVSQSGSGAAS